jgi:hypothetical protein
MGQKGFGSAYMSATATRPSSSPEANTEWVLKDKAVEHMQGKGLEEFTEETLKHYAYRTDLLPRPKVIGKHAYYRLSDLDALIEKL